MKEYTNEIEIRVVGQMRSGNHAIIDWIRRLYPSHKVVFLNNVEHGNFDPFANCANIETFGIDSEHTIEELRRIPDKVLIYSYEDRQTLEEQGLDLISSVFDKEFEKERGNYFGRSKHRFDILIIRDPFNNLASRLKLLRKHPEGMGGLTDLELIRDNWNAVARKVISCSHHCSKEEIVITYNRWLLDDDFKKTLADRLMGDCAPTSLNNIANYGGGSSFEDTNNAANRLTIRDLFLRSYKVFSVKRLFNIRCYLDRIFPKQITHDDFLTRWKAFENDEDYRILFTDRDIFELSETIFGEIPDTRKILSKTQIH